MHRIELYCSDWRSDAQPIGDIREDFGEDEDNRNLFYGLEARAHSMYHARDATYSIVKDLHGAA